MGRLISPVTEEQLGWSQGKPWFCFSASIFGETYVPLSKQPDSCPDGKVLALQLPGLEPESPNTSGPKPLLAAPGAQSPAAPWGPGFDVPMQQARRQKPACEAAACRGVWKNHLQGNKEARCLMIK